MVIEYNLLNQFDCDILSVTRLTNGYLSFNRRSKTAIIKYCSLEVHNCIVPI